MSNLLEVREVPGRGRGLFARAPLRAGQTVLVERPVTLTVAADAQLDVCATCLRRLPFQGAEGTAGRAIADRVRLWRR